MQYLNHLHSEAVTVRIQSELPIFTDEKDFHLTNAFVPGASVSVGEWDGPVASTVHIKDDVACGVERNVNSIVLRNQWEGDMPLSIVHFLYSIIQREQLKREKYAVHSSCVARGSQGYLLIGHSGSGKTTTALTMVGEHGFNWYSGNKTLLNFIKGTDEGDGHSLDATSGTLPVTLERGGNAINDAIFDESVQIDFADRQLRLIENRYHYPAAQLAIAGIFLVRVNDGVRKVKQLSADNAIIPLFPFFYDYFNTDIHLPGNGLYSPSSVTDDHRVALKKRLRAALENVPVFQMSGSFDYMARHINKVAE